MKTSLLPSLGRRALCALAAFACSVISLSAAEPRTVPDLGLTLMPVPAGTMGSPERQEKDRPPKKMSGSGLGSLVLEGHELHASLKTGPIDDDSVRHVKRAPGNPHVSTNADFVTGIARGASQGSLGSEGIRSVLYALYREKNDLGFYGLEAVSAADADRWEEALRKIWSVMGGIGHAQVHRAGLVIVVVWNDGVSPECWKAVNAKVVERLVAP